MVNTPLWKRGARGDLNDLKTPSIPLFQRGRLLEMLCKSAIY